MRFNLNWGAWLYGIGSGFIGGGAGAVTGGLAAQIVDPKDMAVGTGKSLELMGACFLINGMLSMFFYLKQHPLPDEKTVTTVETVKQQTNPPAIVTTTVEKTTVGPSNPTQ